MIEAVDLQEILEKHQKWLDYEVGGERADLSYANLSNADLSYANLSYANLSNADLSYANLSYANLRNTDLTGANLHNANLRNTNLTGANLHNADLTGADLCNANLADIKLDNAEQCRKGIILQEPRMAFKKCDKFIVQLEIPKGAIVFSINNRRCRTNKAKPVAILDLENKVTNRKHITSDYDSDFVYNLMQDIEIKDFDLMYNVECSTGIHFYWDFESAKNHE